LREEIAADVAIENKQEETSNTKETNMRKVGAKLIAGLLGLLVAFASAADCASNMCSDVYVDQIYVEGVIDNWIRTSGTETSLSVCTPDSGVYLWLDGAAAQKKEVLALLMMAYAMDKPVSIKVTNGARGCHISYVFINR
jgi:hypothetical protein